MCNCRPLAGVIPSQSMVHQCPMVNPNHGTFMHKASTVYFMCKICLYGDYTCTVIYMCVVCVRACVFVCTYMHMACYEPSTSITTYTD